MCLNLNADPKRSAHFFSLVYFVLTLVLSILEMAAKCASLHDSSCHHYHLSMLPNVRKEIPLPPPPPSQRHTKAMMIYYKKPSIN